jgi:hypothetical protein
MLNPESAHADETPHASNKHSATSTDRTTRPSEQRFTELVRFPAPARDSFREGIRGAVKLELGCGFNDHIGRASQRLSVQPEEQ